MKRQILMILFAASVGTTGYAQCDKKVIITSSKTEHLDGNGEVQRTEDETTTIEFDKKDIIITPGNNPSMQGTIKSDSCSWKTPFKEGKTILKVNLTDPGGQTMDLTITIEGKDGKINFLAEIDDQPDHKIRVVVDKFEEKK